MRPERATKVAHLHNKFMMRTMTMTCGDYACDYCESVNLYFKPLLIMFLSTWKQMLQLSTQIMTYKHMYNVKRGKAFFLCKTSLP